MDIEYAEFASLTSLSNAYPAEFPIGQLLVELHLFGNKGITSGDFITWWESLEERGLRPTWTEPNLLAVTLHLEDSMPRLAEYTLLNTKDSRNVLFEGLQK
jgi:hypothetical protein